ncbi:two-component system, OmpR family, osmolarity sensor histidine kinase EnvZ [Azospirillaceae bacterium]
MILNVLSRILPKSLSGRTILALLIGLTTSHLLSMTVYSSEELEFFMQLDERQNIDRIVDIVRLLDEIPPQWRELAVKAVEHPPLHVSITTKSVLAPTLGNQDAALIALLHRRLEKDTHRQILITQTDLTKLKGKWSLFRWMQGIVIHLMHGMTHNQIIQASIETRDGLWINFYSRMPDFHPTWSGHAAQSTFIMGIAILLLSFWVVHRLTRPLSRVAAAAERIGRDVDAPPLPETGPLEVRLVANAFNKMQERLRRFVEDRTRMLAAISHDLRTPITLLRLRTEFITENEEKVRILSTLDEMETMIAATLSFAREDATNEPRIVVDIGGLLSSICYDMADAGFPVSFEPTLKIPFDCRLTAMKRAFSNLIDNAVKYGKSAKVALTISDANLIISVDDDGPGIPEREQENVFAPFYRIEPSRNTRTGGVGLGLCVARTIIHAHGGQIRLKNKNEGGLKVEVILPLRIIK